MAKIKLGEMKNIELEITPLSVWKCEKCEEEECMKYRVSFSVDGKNILNLPEGTSLFAVKGEGSDFLADFFAHVLEKGQGENWVTVFPCTVDSFYLGASSVEEKENEDIFTVGLSVAMDACVPQGTAGLGQTGMWIDLGGATKEDWQQFADQLYQEEENAPETTDEAAPAVEKPAQEEPWNDIFSQEVEITRHKR